MASPRKNRITLLVHYSAPATVKYDRKWQHVAENVLNFNFKETRTLADSFLIDSETPTSYQPCQLRNGHLNQDVPAILSTSPEIPVSQSNIDGIDIKELLASRKRERKHGKTPRVVHQKGSAGYLSKHPRREIVHANGTAFSKMKQGHNQSFRNSCIASKSHMKIDAECEVTLSTKFETAVNVPCSGNTTRTHCASDSLLLSDNFKSPEYQTKVISRNNVSDCNLSIACNDTFATDISKLVDDHCSSFSFVHRHTAIAATDDINAIIDTDNPRSEKPQYCLQNVYPSTSSSRFDPALRPLTATSVRCRSGRTLDLFLSTVEPQNSLQRERHPNVITIPRELRQIVSKIKPWHRFQPRNVLRDVKNMERGYWKINLNLASSSAVAPLEFLPKLVTQLNKTHCLPRNDDTTSIHSIKAVTVATEHILPSSSKFEGELSCWTDAAFSRFYERLENFVKKGYATWSTRVFIVHQQASSKGRDIEMRVYTFGQIIEHIWVVLCNFSDGRIKRVPIEWIDSEGHAIVCM